jgi:hypothetical protein
MENEERLTKIELNSGKDDLFIYIDKTKINAIQVQTPLESDVELLEDNSLGLIRIFCEGIPAPFQLTRKTAEELDVVIAQLL